MAAGNTYVALATNTLGSAASSVTFSSISGAYTDLVIVFNGANDTGAGYLIQLEFNSDTAANYSTTRLRGDGSSATSLRYTGTTSGWLAWTTTVFSTVTINIQNYSNATTYKTSLSRWGAAAYRIGADVSLWRSTTAITSIKIVSESPSLFVSGSTFTLYGILAA